MTRKSKNGRKSQFFSYPTFIQYPCRGGSKILVWEGHWQGVWRRKSPSGVQGQSPGGGLGAKPQKPEEFYVIRLKKHLRREKNESLQIDIV